MKLSEKEIKETIINALGNEKGDDLIRAKIAFRSYSTEQMQKIYGQSGQTPAEINEGYEKREARVQQAIDWMNEKA